MRVATEIRIEDRAQRAHRIEVILGKLLGHEINFLDADAVLARHASTQLHTLVEDRFACGHGAPDLIRVAFVVEDERMNIPVAGVKNIRDPKIELGAGGGDEPHDDRQLGTRNDSILCQIIRAQSSNGTEGPLAAFPEQAAFVFCFRDLNFAGFVLAADFKDSFGLTIETRGEAVELDDEHGARIQGKSEVIRRLHCLSNLLVHHLHRAGHNPRGNDVTHGLAGVIDVFENSEKSFVCLGSANQFYQNASDHSEHSFASDSRASQVVAIIIFAAIGCGAEPNNFAVGQHQLETEDVIGRDAIFQSVRSSGICGDVSANRASRLAGGIGRVKEALGFYGLSDPGIDTARFDQGPSISVINRKDLVHASCGDHDTAFDGQDSATQARAGAARDNWNFLRRALFDDRGHLLGGTGKHNDVRQILLQRVGVALINEEVLGAGDYAIVAYNRPQHFNEFRGQRMRCREHAESLVVPPLQ